MAKSPKPPVSPFLKYVHLKDYRSIQDAETYFECGINIIIGPNGSGKTSFLGLTSELIVPYFLPLKGEGCELVIGWRYDFRVSFGQRAIKRAKNAFEQHNLIARERIPITIEANGIVATSDYISDAFTDLKLDIPYYWPVAIWHGVMIENTPVISISADLKIDTFGVAKFNGYNSLDNPASSMLTDELISCLGRLFSLKSYSVQKVSVRRAANAIKNLVEVFVSELNKYLSSYSSINSVRVSDGFKLYSNKEQGEIVVKGLVLEYQANNNWLPFSELSDGTKRMVYIISQLVSPILTSFPKEKVAKFSPIKFNKIFFIEEPELGIHHSQLHKLLELVREVSQKNQVIMTTHAPQVLDMLAADELDRITICSLDPKKGTQFHKLSEEKQEQARVYMEEVGFLSDYWRYSYLEEAEAE